MNISTIAQKLWNYCNILRDDGLSYGDYVGQLTFSALAQDGPRAKPAAVLAQVANPGRVFVVGAAS